MATLPQILAANLAIPMAIETKLAFLPKISAQMGSLAARVPGGPDLPSVAVTILEPPAPNRAGQPLAGFFNSEPIKGPMGRTATQTSTTSLPLSPPTPGASRGSIDYAGLPLSPSNPGAARGTILYGE